MAVSQVIVHVGFRRDSGEKSQINTMPTPIGTNAYSAKSPLNLGRTYTFHCRRKSKANLENSWGFLVNVWLCSALTLTLSQRLQSSSLSVAHSRCANMRCQEKLTYGWVANSGPTTKTHDGHDDWVWDRCRC